VPDADRQPALEVVEGGLLTTVQDAGRPDWTRLGVPTSGAADAWSLAVANSLVGNFAGAAALEMTGVGPTLRVLRPLTIGLAGGDFGGVVRRGAGVRRLEPGHSHRVEPGDVLTLPGATSPTRVRAYLALPGGIDVPVVLGSRSTCLAAAFGGYHGRPVRTGDRLAALDDRRPAEVAWPSGDADGHGARDDTDTPLLRAIAGPSPGFDALEEPEWRVATASDRVGVRLDGGPLREGIGGETTTHGVVRGAIQVPPDGRPIVLGPDHQTTGGYRVPGVVIAADLPVLGQLGPGAVVRFVAVGRDEAVEAARRREAALAAGREAIRDATAWHDLADGAGG
jgi:antagonist of KipI